MKHYKQREDLTIGLREINRHNAIQLGARIDKIQERPQRFDLMLGHLDRAGRATLRVFYLQWRAG